MSEKTEANAFLKQLEEENGGNITFRTFCRLYGFSDGRSTDLGGLLYTVDTGKIIFEDFEKENNGIAALFTRRTKVPYEKFKITQDVNTIEHLRYVSQAAVKRQLGEHKEVTVIRELSGFRKILFKPILELSFSNTHSWFIEVLEDKAFMNHIQNEVNV
jgi:hypothetical protein